MTEKIEVRFANLGDLDFVGQDGYIPTEVVKRKIVWNEVVVAVRDCGLVGYLRLEYLWSLIPYIALIWVLPEHRRQGVGKAIVHFIEEFLRGRGHNTLYSSSQVNDQNHRRGTATWDLRNVASSAVSMQGEWVRSSS